MFGLSFAKDFFISEKAPYVVTLFVAALAWTTVRTSDRLSSVPFVEYRITPERSESGQSGVELRLRNVTAASKFDCFLLLLAPHKDASLKFGDLKDMDVRLRGTVLARPEPTHANEYEWEIKISKMSPGADLSLFIPSSGSGNAAVLVSPCPNEVSTAVPAADNEAKKGVEKNEAPKSAAPSPPILIERSGLTFFVEYEIAILWVGLGGWLLLMLVSGKKPKMQPREPNVTHVLETTHDVPGSLE